MVTDHLGSVRVVINANTGSVAQIMEHDTYGVVTQDTSSGLTPFGFAGGLYTQQSGLVRFGARDYDPYAGRWTAKDPIRFSGGDENLYGYVLQDPVNLIDPSGLEAMPEFPDHARPPRNPRDALDVVNPAYPNRGKTKKQNDVLRHCIASCYAASVYGNAVAELLGDLNEMRPNNTPESKCQDLRNNKIGRDHGGEGVSAQLCQIKCLNDLDRGRLY